ncbi:MAG: PqqD family protein [Anaerolineae bacterium]|nr:PqqD family protein [Anaerolineae bacterium]MDW8070903.1 PqqD family protein [Anaerolineae bacterium]
MSAPRYYQANPVVSCRDEGEDGAILFDPDRDEAAILNPTGRVLWSLLAEPRTVEELAAYLVAHYEGVTPEQARQDVIAFLGSLRDGFVHEVRAVNEA